MVSTTTVAAALAMVTIGLASAESLAYYSQGVQLSQTKAALDTEVSGLQGTVNALQNALTSAQQVETADSQKITQIQNELQKDESTLVQVSSSLSTNTGDVSAIK